MRSRVFIRESATRSEAQIWCQILAWNGIRAEIVASPETGRVKVEVDASDERTAHAVLNLIDNTPPDNPDRFAFLSHTRTDQAFIEEHIVPLLQHKYIDFVLLNYSRFTEEYARLILRALSNSGWFVAVLSRRAKDSPWVKFEVDWALQHRDASHIIPVVIDEIEPGDIDSRLHLVEAVDFRSPSPEARRRLSERLPEIGFLDRFSSPRDRA